MRRQLTLITMLLIPLAGGCLHRPPAINSSLEVTPPAVYEIVSEKRILTPVSEAVVNLVENIVNSPYSIESMDRDAGIVRIAFTITDPEGCVDCGSARRTRTLGEETAAYDYQLAGDSYYEAVYSRQNGVSVERVSRDATLTGVATVNYYPEDSVTRVVVTVEYLLTSSAAVKSTLFGTWIKGIDPDRLEERGFSRVAEIDLASDRTLSDYFNLFDHPFLIQCRCTGELEREILALIE